LSTTTTSNSSAVSTSSAAIVASALIAGIVGYASLPLREEYVAIATLAAAELFTDVTANLPSITGGAIGYVSIPQPINAWAGGHYGTFLTSTLLVMIGILSFGYVLFRRLTDGPYGRVLRAIRADKKITDTIGKHVFRYEMEVFVFAAVVAGIAGSMYALFIGAAAPGLYSTDVTFLLWIGMLVGGAGNHRGVLAGLGTVMAFELLTRFLNELPYYTPQQFGALRLAMIGLLLIVVVRYRPEGIWGNAKEQGIE
jgi:branched-chain amino acid transport system permease protein